jgi:hypothetical protein
VVAGMVSPHKICGNILPHHHHACCLNTLAVGVGSWWAMACLLEQHTVRSAKAAAGVRRPGIAAG